MGSSGSTNTFYNFTESDITITTDVTTTLQGGKDMGDSHDIDYYANNYTVDTSTMLYTALANNVNVTFWADIDVNLTSSNNSFFYTSVGGHKVYVNQLKTGLHICITNTTATSYDGHNLSILKYSDVFLQYSFQGSSGAIPPPAPPDPVQVNKKIVYLIIIFIIITIIVGVVGFIVYYKKVHKS